MALSQAILLLRRTSFALALSLFAVPTAAQDSPRDLIEQARALAQQCDYAGATDVSNSLLERLGPQDAGLRLFALQDAATYANAQGQYEAALRLSEDALALVQRAEPEPGRYWATVAQNKAVALSGLGRFAEAERLFGEVLNLAETAAASDLLISATIAATKNALRANRPQFADSLADRLYGFAISAELSAELRAQALLEAADGFRRMLRFAEAEQALMAAQAVSREPASPRLALTRAALEAERGNLSGALDRVGEISDIVASPCDPFLQVDRHYLLGNIQMLRREVPEAFASFGNAMRELELAGRFDPVRAAEITYGLAIAASMGREFDRSSELFDRSARLYREVYRRPTEAEAQVQMERALMLIEADEPQLALLIAEEALAMLETEAVEVRPLTPAYARATLGLAAHRAGEWELAERQLALALDDFAAARGESFDLAPGLLALAEIAASRGALEDAKAHIERALDIYREAGGDSALGTGTALSRLALVAELEGEQSRSRDYSRRAMEVLQRRLAVGEQSAWNDAESERRAGDSIIANELRLVSQDCPPELAEQCVARQFTAIQLASATRAGGAITQLANRLETAEPDLARLLRERTDLAEEWRTIQDTLIGGFTQVATDTLLDARLVLVQRLTEIEARIAAIDAEIQRRNPQLDLLLKTRVVDRDAVRQALGEGEAFLTLAVEDDRSYITVLHQGGRTSYSVPVGRAEVDRLAAAIRLSIEPDSSGLLYDYDLGAARELFAALFEQAMPTLQGIERLAYVPDGSLASLPLAVLLTRDAPIDLPYAEQPWLGRRFTVTTFPSAASLVALRSIARNKPNRQSFLGVGDPDFAGTAANASFRGNLIASLTRSRLADPELIRAFTPLPETREEIEAIANYFPTEGRRILLGEDSNEATLRSASLSNYDVIAFATHAVVAGEINGYAEPAIILTPPENPNAFNDGMLSASEIAGLDLDARLVVLSACNTAADNGELNAEPLSGLAQSFFYAGAQSLLVSHWEVESSTTADLTVRLIELQNQGIDLGAGLQVVMEEFLLAPNNSRDHPFFWAPFVVIG